MFGNRVAYTQSPGGIRRGLIWQSSEDIPPEPYMDPSNYIWDYRVGCKPGNIPWIHTSSGDFKRTVSSNNPYFTSLTPVFNDPGVISGSDLYGPVFNSLVIPKYDVQEIEIPLTLFGYYDSFIDDPNTGEPYMASLGKVTAYLMDISFQYYPWRCTLYSNGASDDTPDLIKNGFVSPNTPPWCYETVNGFEIDSDCGIMNKGYYTRTNGQTLYSPQTSSGVQLMQTRALRRVSFPSCPTLFRGRVVFCELDFAASQGMTFQGIDPDAITAYLTNILDQYAMPVDNLFIGCKTYNRQQGRFFNNFTLQGLHKKIGYNSKHVRQNSMLTRYQYSEGIISENNLFTMMYSPVVPPSVYLDTNDYDYILRLGRGIIPNATMFKQVSDPEIAAPHISLPVMCGGLRTHLKTPSSIWWNQDTYYPSYIIPRYSYQGDVTSGSSHLDLLMSYGGTTFTNQTANGPRGGSYSYNGYAYPYSMLTQDYTDFNEQTPPFTPFHDVLSRGFSDDPTETQAVIDTIRYSTMQPKLNFHEKYLVEVMPVNSLCNIWYASPTSGWSSQHSGKYKYVGMKGKVSLFENFLGT